MLNVDFHIHINTIATELDSYTKKKVLQLGFRYKAAKIFINKEKGVEKYRDKQYLGLYSCNVKTSKQRDFIFNQSIQLLRSTNHFNGYIESESVADGLVEKFEPSHFINKSVFPLKGLQMVQKRKKADIHIYRPLSAGEDLLHYLLLDNNFYEVQTSTKRIYTIELESMKSAKVMYKLLHGYFIDCGGILELECEVVNDLELSADDFLIRSVVSKDYN